MIDYQPLYDALLAGKALQWATSLPNQIAKAFDTTKHGTLPQWQSLVDGMPTISTSHRCLTANAVQIGKESDLTDVAKIQLEKQLKVFQPWRKGPYELFGIHIDTEWRSDWKWNRVKDHISSLEHRLVLDVGCGNGYHCWRMLGANAKMVVGIDPLLLNVMQFQLIRKLYGEAPVYVLPMGLEELPSKMELFDTVLSMGVLYHRRSPIDHLLELRGCLKSGGELVLETLIIDGCLGEALVPESRYANMRNVWFIPSCETLISWMTRCGFENIRLIDVTVTSIEEQRTTEWMTFNSLPDFLDPANPRLTVEGLPAPQRAIIIANAP